ncbi:uncharacterized protein [Ptychodera flava]|uniref:uncharacterized protein isoform X2 n=1 Tax=Ptychodera flava TaxID=63121 RepID=UPI00396A9CA5
MTERCLAALDYVDLQCQQLHKKHTKNRSLGDLESKYRYQPPRSATTIVSKLVDLDFPETRAINDLTANSIIKQQTRQIQYTYKKATRTVSSAPPSRGRTIITPKSTPLSKGRRPCTPEGSRPRLVNTTRIRPFTASEANKLSRSRMSSASSRAKVPRSKSADIETGRFMTVKVKRDPASKSASFREVSRNIHNKWDAEDKTMKQGVKKGRKAGTFDPNSAQWYTFSGGGSKHGRVVDAFTGKEVAYKIEGSVGDKVAQQVKGGSKVRIGINGTLQADIKAVTRKRENSASPSDNLPKDSESRNGQSGVVDEIVPLCWQDQLTRPTTKVVEALTQKPSPPKVDLSERHPVIFEKLIKDDEVKSRTELRPNSYRVRQRVKNKLNIDGTASLNNRITVVTVDQFDDDQESLSSRDYNDILSEKLHADSVPMVESQQEVSVDERPKSSKKKEMKQEENLRSVSRESFHSSGSLEKPITPQASIVSSTVADHTFITTGINPHKFQKPGSPSPRVPSGSNSVRTNPDKSVTKAYPPVSKTHGLAKPGQLYRSGIPSINNMSLRDSEQTSFIQIAQAINFPDASSQHDLPLISRSNSDIGASAQHNARVISTVTETNRALDNLPPKSRYSDGDRKSGDVMNLRGKQMHVVKSEESCESNSRRSSAGSMPSAHAHHSHRVSNGHVCTCTPEAKRAIATIMSQEPPPAPPTSPPGSVREEDTRHYINIPTAAMLPGESDVHSISDLDVHGPAGMLIDDDMMSPRLQSDDARVEKENYVTLENLAEARLKIEDHLQFSAEDTQQAVSETMSSDSISERDLADVEEPTDHMIMGGGDASDEHHPTETVGEPVVHKSVRFADDKMTDISADTAALIKSVGKEGDLMHVVTISKDPVEELNHLRTKIKSDLQQTQEDTQQDIQNLYLKQHSS